MGFSKIASVSIYFSPLRRRWTGSTPSEVPGFTTCKWHSPEHPLLKWACTLAHSPSHIYTKTQHNHFASQALQQWQSLHVLGGQLPEINAVFLFTCFSCENKDLLGLLWSSFTACLNCTTAKLSCINRNESAVRISWFTSATRLFTS